MQAQLAQDLSKGILGIHTALLDEGDGRRLPPSESSQYTGQIGAITLRCSISLAAVSEGECTIGIWTKRSMQQGFQVTLDLRSGADVCAVALRAGSRAAARALSIFDATMLRRLQPLACRPRSELVGVDYLDASVIEYALFRALEAAFPETGGEPPFPLTRESFFLRITEAQSVTSPDELPA